MIAISILHIEQYRNPSQYTISPTKIPVVTLHGFHVPISLIPMQVMKQIPTG